MKLTLNSPLRFCAAGTIALALAATGHAATILGINFNNGDGAGSQANGNLGATWTNVDSGASGQDLSVNGTTGVNVDWASSNFWGAGSWMSSNTNPANAFNTPIGMMRAYLDDGDTLAAGYAADLGISGTDGIGVSVRLQGLSAWLASEGMTAYTIRAFYSTDSGSATFRDITLRNGNTVTSPILETLTGTVRGDGGWDGTTDDAGGNDLTGTRGDAITLGQYNADNITLTIANRSGSTRGTLAGLVVTAVPEPSTAMLCGFGIFSMLGRRRRR